jgi:phosphoglycerate kinase
MYKTDKNLQDFSYKNIQDIQNKRVIVRACLNVATDDEGVMTEPTRFNEAMPLIKELAKSAKSVVIMAHLGRPEKREKKFSFWNVAEAMQKELDGIAELEIIDDLTPETIQKIQSQDNSTNRKVFFLDNIRFFPGEETKDKEARMEFAKVLGSLAEVFINDAFPDYKEAASTYDIAKVLPSYMGPVFLKEVESLSKFSTPERPFVAVLGGAKLSEKLDALNALAEIADKVIIGGAMAYTLMKAKGISIGNSLVENDKLDIATEINTKYGDKIVLPVDHLVTTEFSKDAPYEYLDEQNITEGKIAIDIGWESINLYKSLLAEAKSILWNGPMGVFEWTQGEPGTKEVGQAIVNNSNAFKLAGGGDSIAAINKFNLQGFDHVSTGGGAMLAFLAYDKFPILDVIIN